MNTITVKNPILRRVVHSKYIDIFGVILIVCVTVYRGFHTTMYYNGGVLFNTPLNLITDYISKGAFPIGLLSILGAVFSLLATRFHVKQNNLGNIIWLFTTINSGVLDYLFGNSSAIITYPITFGIAVLSTRNWNKGELIKDADYKYGILIIVSFIVAYTLVYTGFYMFNTPINNPIFIHTIAILFAISLIGNIGTAYKYKQSFIVWGFYNISQIIKNTIQGNLANVIKYLFYMFNTIISYFDWHINGDLKKEM
ncbi:MAG: nicotinamide mononucleotide transporter family protein [Winogradskyella sp.]